MNKYIIKVHTNWCGMDQEYAAIAKNKEDLESIAAELAYDNFAEFDLLYEVAAELFPDEEGEEFSDSQLDAAAEVEGKYYWYTINDFDEELHGNFEWYELVYGKDEDV